MEFNLLHPVMTALTAMLQYENLESFPHRRSIDTIQRLKVEEATMQMNIHKDHQDNGLSIHNNCIYISRAAHTRKMLSIALISVSISHVQGLGLFYGGPFVTKIGTTCTC